MSVRIKKSGNPSQSFSSAHLCDEDAQDNAKLVEGPQGPPQGSRGHLANIHGHETCGEARVEANDEAAKDEHLKGESHLGEAHEDS